MWFKKGEMKGSNLHNHYIGDNISYFDGNNGLNKGIVSPSVKPLYLYE